jgi:hypothetical protein
MILCGTLTENESDNRRLLLAITVEIEDGVVEYIEMKEGDSAEAVAVKFCRDHSLPDQFVAPLTEHIVSNIISIRCGTVHFTGSFWGELL